MTGDENVQIWQSSSGWSFVMTYEAAQENMELTGGRFLVHVISTGSRFVLKYPPKKKQRLRVDGRVIYELDYSLKNET